MKMQLKMKMKMLLKQKTQSYLLEFTLSTLLSSKASFGFIRLSLKEKATQF